MNHSSHAFVLSGGGAYAAYEVGVMLALCRGDSPATGGVPVDPAILAGTSAGSLNAAILASRVDLPAVEAVEHLASIWRDRLASGPGRRRNGVYRLRGDLTFLEHSFGSEDRNLGLLALERDVQYLGSDLRSRLRNLLGPGVPLAWRIAQLFDVSVFLNPEPFIEVLDEVLDPEAICFSHRRLRLALVDWRTGVLSLIANEHMAGSTAAQVVLASCAVPGFFRPVELAGSLYADGGVLMNTPLRPAIEAGADCLHAIYMDPDPAAIELSQLNSAVSTLERVMLIQRAALINSDCDHALRINQGLALVEQVKRGQRPRGGRGAVLGIRSLVRELEGFDGYRPVTVHRYHPRGDLGGLAGILNVEIERVDSLIAQGYLDAVQHNCQEAQCVMPGIPD